MGMHSGLVLSQGSDRPMYVQIVDQVKQRVTVGDWVPGTEIPSIRGLAVEVGVSVITVKRAYSELERQGIIVTTQGKRSFITDRFPDLGVRLRTDELSRHLKKAVEISRLLGMEAGELHDALRDAEKQPRGSGS